MHRLGTLFFVAFGAVIVGYVALFALNSQEQFSDLQAWAQENKWEFERPGNRVSFRIKANINEQNWTLEAIQGDKLAPPSLDAKPKTIWRTATAQGVPYFVVAPPMPPGVYNNPSTRQENQRKLFEYMLPAEASKLPQLMAVPGPENLQDKFTFFVEKESQGSFFFQQTIIEQLLQLREQLGHSPILVSSQSGLSIRAQTMVFGPKILNSLIQFGRSTDELVRPKDDRPI